MKICSVCKETKPLDAFHKRRTAKDGRASSCKTCYSAYYKRHAISIKARVREYAERHKPEIKAYLQRYQQNHKEQRRRYVNQFRKIFGRIPWKGKKAYDHRRYETHKNKYFDYAAKRRALKQHPGIPAKLVSRKMIFQRDNFTCHICKKKVKTPDLSIDHLIPLSHGGMHIPENLATAHLRCNLRRGPGRIAAQLRLFD